MWVPLDDSSVIPNVETNEWGYKDSLNQQVRCTASLEVFVVQFHY